jgi:probable addiction module antidote protein
MPKRTSDFDSWEQEKLSNPALAARYLSAILEQAPEQFAAGLGNVARAHQITSVAEQAGTARETLYRSLSDEGNPTWKMLSSVMKVLQVKFKGIEEDTITATPSGHSPSPVARVKRRRRSGASRNKQSYFATSGQLTLAFPMENANVVKAGKTVRLFQPSASAKLPSFSWIPDQQEKESTNLEFNAMLATMAQTTDASSQDSGRGWV